ncbi:Hypothetical predicted protein [Mytilus galloprovincialis]|uniref:DZIP3-like HEPN domain-containing protein n=1 Tax=Mytilus galloprovincialis TaxID=29158 RepID=A0A8B6FZS9_MYTGA|nr:Hypothetical predicted protein [Mytilus galloprovincialis]
MHSDEERRLAHMGQIVLHFFPMILRVILTEVNEINQFACRSIQNNRDFKSKLFEDENSIVLSMINNGYSFFNIQLCYKMLRHFEWINPPRKGWGNEIEDADIELADDIERIRQISNTVILMPLHQVSEIVYSSVMQKVKEISVRIASFKKESNRSKESIYSCEIGNKETLEEDEISTLLNNLRKMHEIKNNPFPCNPVTKGMNRYSRLGLVIVNAFPNMYREIVSSNISANMLYRQIKKNLKQNPHKFDKLTHDERTGLNLLKNGSYGEIDFTTIYKLIRAFDVVDVPNQGWAKTPTASDTEIADDIERMRIIRNKIVHKIKAEVSKVEMNDLFTEITSIASRVDRYLGKQLGAGFETEISKYRTCPLDHDLEQKYTQALQEIENMKGKTCCHE